MTGTDVVQRTPEQQLVAAVRGDAFKQQIAMVLPPTVTPERFARIATTAIMTNAEIAKIPDQQSIMRAFVQAAAAGLMPDGKEAAIVGRGGKAVFQPMVYGLQKTAADFGWALRYRSVREHDEFEYTEEPPSIQHRLPRPGLDRGDLIAAYAIATHRDGRRQIKVMYAVDILKRREIATTKQIWDKWPDEMWAKTPAKAVVKELPLTDADRERLFRIVDAVSIDPAEAIESLYGPDSPPARQIAAPSTVPPTTGTPTAEQGGDSQQAADAPPDPGVSAAPGPDDEPDLDRPELNADEQAAIEAAANEAAIFELPSGKHVGKTLGEIAGIEGSDGWFVYGLRKDDLNPVVSTAVWNFCRVHKPELYQQVLAEKEAAAA
jgi:recombination protein RecT